MIILIIKDFSTHVHQAISELHKECENNANSISDKHYV